MEQKIRSSESRVKLGFAACYRRDARSSLELCRVVTDFDNVKFSNNSFDLQILQFYEVIALK